MAFSLYDATIPCFDQILEALSGQLDKAEAYCAEKGIAPEGIIQARLIEDMFPFAYQVKSSVVHSLGAIEGVRKGIFGPDMSTPPASFAALKQRVSGAREAFKAIDPAEINAFEGRNMRFEHQGRGIDFTAEKFLLSFSMPNFYFHATTAYDILRSKGIEVGKRDFMGRMQKKR